MRFSCMLFGICMSGSNVLVSFDSLTISFMSAVQSVLAACPAFVSLVSLFILYIILLICLSLLYDSLKSLGRYSCLFLFIHLTRICSLAALNIVCFIASHNWSMVM